MSGNIIDEEQDIFTIANPALIGPIVDRIVIREGSFQVLNVSGSFTTVTVNATNANITNLNVTALGANSVIPTPPGSGVNIDGVVIRDRPHYIVPLRSVASFEGSNPASSAGVSVAIVPRGTGALIAAVPDGTTTGGNTRGDNSVDWQMIRVFPTQVCAGSFGVISGGVANMITFNSSTSTIGGGLGNSINSSLGTTFANTITGGQENVITNCNNSAIIGGANNNISDSNNTIAGGFNNVCNSAENSTMLGFQNTIGNSSILSTTIGTLCSISGACPNSMAVGYRAQSNAFMAHTFCATDVFGPDGLENINTNPRSHKFIDNIFETYVNDREIHNKNTLFWYHEEMISGPVTIGRTIKLIPFEFSQHSTMYFHFTCGGGNTRGTALGYGYIRARVINGPPEAGPYPRVTGTTVFASDANEDGAGMGFTFDVVYSGMNVGVRIYLLNQGAFYSTVIAMRIRDVRVTLPFF